MRAKPLPGRGAFQTNPLLAIGARQTQGIIQPSVGGVKTEWIQHIGAVLRRLLCLQCQEANTEKNEREKVFHRVLF